MSLEQKSVDLIDEFEIHYQNIKGKKYAANGKQALRRGLPGFNEGLKRYIEDNPYVSSVDLSDVRSELSESEYQLADNVGFQLYADFLDFAGHDEIFDENIIGDRYRINSEAINQDINPIDRIIDQVETKETVQVEANLVEYVVADIYRKNLEAPQRTEVKLEMEERLGYELHDGQIEQRLAKNGRIEPNRTGGGIENSFSFQR